MLYDEIEFQNVDHLQEISGVPGLRLERFPHTVSQRLGKGGNYKGRFRAERAHGCELRFVTESPYFDLAVMALGGDIEIIIYRGDLLHDKKTLREGSTSIVHIETHEIYDYVKTEKLPHGRFAPYVWRILIGLNGYLHYLYLDTFGYSHRAPNADEKPQMSWAAYGSSITCGSKVSVYSNSYINQAAIRLGYDVLNKGLSGSCHMEAFVSDYLASLEVDCLTLELGVNMLVDFDEGEFLKRIQYLLKTLKECSLSKRIYIMDVFPNKGLIMSNETSKNYINYRKFREIVQVEVNEINDSRLIHILGDDILRDFTYLTTDLLHPSDEGHILMGENLANIINRKKGV